MLNNLIYPIFTKLTSLGVSFLFWVIEDELVIE